MKRIKLQNQIMAFILIFAAIIIALLWLMQIVFFEEFYQNYTSQQITRSASRMVKRIDNQEEFNQYVQDLTINQNYCIQVFEKIDAQHFQELPLATGENASCEAIQANQDVSKLYAGALENDNELVDVEDIQLEFGGKPLDAFANMTVTNVITSKNDNTYMVIVNARLSPTSETVAASTRQLFIITWVVLAMSFIIAYLIAWTIANPIKKTNGKAKLLAQNNLDIHFDARGYMEIEELNDTLNYAVEELKKVESMRNELMANVSHDLRTPLTMITGYGEVMRDLPGENTQENIQVIIDEAQRLTQLVNNLLDLSKIQTNRQELHIAEFDITTTIQDIVNRINKMLANDGYIIEFNYSEELFVYADKERINQVVYNIVGNAIHFTGSDKKVYVNQRDEGHRVRIEITDTGKGIKKSQIPYIWDRYFKQPKKWKRQDIGTGLGLNIVKGILELHRVEYGVESEVNKGTTFFFYLDKA